MIEDIAAVRRRTMQAVRSKDTKPELAVRRIVFKLGYRYRLHKNDLPGKPDLTFIGRRKVVFVHGCFWHGHTCVRGNRLPKTNTEYWCAKIARNKARDAANMAKLKASCWRVLVIWECELKDTLRLTSKLDNFLNCARHALASVHENGVISNEHNSS